MNSTVLRTVLIAVGVVILMFVFSVAAQAQNGAGDIRFGAYGYGALVQHDAVFRTLPEVGCCGPGFTGGDGVGSGFGLMLQLPVASTLAFQLRAGYAGLDGEMNSSEFIGNALQGDNVVDAYSNHRIASKLDLISVEPIISIRPFAFPLALNLGGEMSFVASSNYQQDETLATPGDATFVGGSRVRNQSSGELPGAAPLMLSAVGGVSYDIPLGTSGVTIAPEVSYRRQLNNLIRDSSWQAHALRVGASIAFALRNASSTESIAVNDGILSATVSATGVQSDGSESPIVRMTVEEFMLRQHRPLLNYVFFDEGTSTIDRRYNRLDRDAARAFSVDDLYGRKALETYYDVMNIIGRRMTSEPKSTIRLIGCNDGSETGGIALSRRRAEAVRDYLKKTWGIAESRMKIEARVLPTVPSRSDELDGRVENRRVELVADRHSITDPVFTNDTLITSDPPKIHFNTSVSTDAGVASWKVAVMQNGRVLRELVGRGDVPSTVTWDISSDRGAMPRDAAALEYRLDVVDNDGRSFSTETRSIGVEVRTLRQKSVERRGDREFHRFSLLLFDFGRAEIDGGNRSIVDLIRRTITKNSSVEIAGHTDRLGDEQLNHNLSRDRAMAVAKALGVGYENARGLGESPDLYNNNLPEGRFHCRIVDVNVETPVN